MSKVYEKYEDQHVAGTVLYCDYQSGQGHTLYYDEELTQPVPPDVDAFRLFAGGLFIKNPFGNAPFTNQGGLIACTSVTEVKDLQLDWGPYKYTGPIFVFTFGARLRESNPDFYPPVDGQAESYYCTCADGWAAV